MYSFAYKHFRSVVTLREIYLRSLSTIPVIEIKQDINEELKEFETLSKITPKTKVKKPTKPPFAKNLFLGKIDTDILVYPELDKSEFETLEKDVKEIRNYFQNPDFEECPNMLSQQLLQKLAKERLLGLQSSQLGGGRELTATETCRFMEEFAQLPLRNAIINNEQLAINALNKFGTPFQKSKYLTKLMGGHALSAFCIVDTLTADFDILNRPAILSHDNKSWVVNGEQKLVINGSSADIFLILAQTDIVSSSGGTQPKLTAFIVERDFGGVTSKRIETIDPNNLEVSNVVFENVQIPSDNVLGDVNLGENILGAILPDHRLSTGVICSSITKNLINNATKYYIGISQEPFLIYETDAISSKIGEYSTSAYAMDSVIYLTAGLMDTYENQDVDMESIIVKVFASDQSIMNTTSCLDLIGREAFDSGHWCNQLHREAISCAVLNDSNDNLKILIALFGLQHAGKYLNEIVKKVRNPLFYPSYIFKRMWTQSRQADDNPKLNLYLHYELHPSLIYAAQNLEYAILRLQYGTEVILARHANEIMNQHIDLRRLAECVIDIYAMTACVSRASRSYCIGLRHADAEVILATSFCFGGRERVKKRVQEIQDGHFITNDENYRMTSKNIFRCKEYFPVHPLSRNF